MRKIKKGAGDATHCLGVRLSHAMSRNHQEADAAAGIIDLGRDTGFGFGST